MWSLGRIARCKEYILHHSLREWSPSFCGRRQGGDFASAEARRWTEPVWQLSDRPLHPFGPLTFEFECGESKIQTPKIVKPKMKKKDIEIPETTDFSPKAFKKLQRELALARAEIAYLKELEKLDRQKQRQKKEKSLKD